MTSIPLSRALGNNGVPIGGLVEAPNGTFNNDADYIEENNTFLRSSYPNCPAPRHTSASQGGMEDIAVDDVVGFGTSADNNVSVVLARGNNIVSYRAGYSGATSGVVCTYSNDNGTTWNHSAPTDILGTNVTANYPYRRSDVHGLGSTQAMGTRLNTLNGPTAHKVMYLPINNAMLAWVNMTDGTLGNTDFTSLGVVTGAQLHFVSYNASANLYIATGRLTATPTYETIFTCSGANDPSLIGNWSAVYTDSSAVAHFDATLLANPGSIVHDGTNFYWVRRTSTGTEYGLEIWKSTDNMVSWSTLGNTNITNTIPLQTIVSYDTNGYATLVMDIENSQLGLIYNEDENFGTYMKIDPVSGPIVSSKDYMATNFDPNMALQTDDGVVIYGELGALYHLDINQSLVPDMPLINGPSVNDTAYDYPTYDNLMNLWYIKSWTTASGFSDLVIRKYVAGTQDAYRFVPSRLENEHATSQFWTSYIRGR